MAKEIKLNKDMVTIVSDEDFEYLNQWKWTYSKDKRKHTGYVVRGFLDKNKQPKAVKLHREILKAKKGECVDHINGDGLDNRRENIRICTNQENQFNRRKPSNSTSGYVGVVWHTPTSKWQAQININSKKKSLGLYNDIKEAAIAYNNASIKLHGQFARLNEIGV